MKRVYLMCSCNGLKIENIEVYILSRAFSVEIIEPQVKVWELKKAYKIRLLRILYFYKMIVKL